ncbi:phage tail sheath family protein [Kineosporia babensis]|uniref:Phage tail sheath subtilisin-like domain-containing protein n=1 Tax=Kineosporia babensis TaxID=499548 RepID=A0A9X1NJ05_9ACTN|nr:phage tail sheath subtilisin-like domain-containing protein [Kineosporia babensis]MCD5315937.1 phage tail sheath subtilisin-like domain-containing protein [Kineosporia babensis]
MVDYATVAPGIHLEEITPAGPIAGAGTGAAALIGVPARPPTGTSTDPVPLTSWNAYKDQFGEYSSGALLPYAVRGFFDNGGALAYVVPVKKLDAEGMDAAVDALSRVPEVSIVCAPGLTDPALAKDRVIAHCEKMGDRFAVLDAAQDSNPLKADGPLQTQRSGLVSASGFAALYYPWIRVTDPSAAGAKPLPVPPSGHIAGIMARCDATVGVHRAPANEYLRGAIGLDHVLNDVEQGALNAKNINALRIFPGNSVPVVWGARTLSEQTPWRYVNVRRLVSYVEDSLRQGLRWAVFQPNTPGLWKSLERSVAEFLTRVWESGGLFGRTAAEAFYVTVDESVNPPGARERGEVYIEIGLAVTRPAEHVVLRIGLWDGGQNQ